MAIRSPAQGRRSTKQSGAISAATAWCSSRPSSVRRAAVERPRARGREEALLHPAVPLERVLDPLERQRAVLDRVDQHFHRRELRLLRIAAHQHDVASGGNARSVASGDAERSLMAFMPMSSVNTTPSKPIFFLQQPGDDRGRQRAGTLLVERRDQQVRGHDAGDARGDRGLERHELHGLEPVGRMLDERQLVVGVDARIAVPGKMLAAGGDALRLQGLDDDRPEPGDVLGRRPRPIADHGILRVGEDVEHRREVERDADGAELGGQRLANRSASVSSPLRPSVCIGGHSVNGDLSRATRPPS